MYHPLKADMLTGETPVTLVGQEISVSQPGANYV